MKKILENLRWIMLGFVPTMCVFGLLFGCYAAWSGTEAVLHPEAAEEAALPVLLPADGEAESAPPFAEIAGRFPVLVPHSVRLLAWCSDAVRENWPAWEEYLREILTK